MNTEHDESHDNVLPFAHQSLTTDQKREAALAHGHPSLFGVTQSSASAEFSDSEDWILWVQYGRSRGWIGATVCAIHDGVPTTKDEDDQFNDGDDPCVPVVRLFADAAEHDAVMANHLPSVWR